MSTPSPLADRNLLFGILALQVNFISRDALIKGMNAWVLEKHRPLSDLLVEQQALRPDLRDVLEAMVQKHLEVHHNDARQCLAALGSASSVRHELAQVADPDVQASLGHIARASAEEAVQCKTDAYVPSPTSPAVRYKRLRPHARGGLGEVFVALDEELNREVALNEIQNQHADHSDSRARFLLEAEVTGKLEHPGIVPVYGLGRYDDGRPFYAMRFIKGDSLKDAIERYHKSDSSLPPGQRMLALRGLLERFLDVCDAVAYAHSRGVLHRDLKPGNVMLGRYGETLVVDWGLAKVLGRTEEVATEDTPLTTSLSDDVTPTQAGQAIGTPQYMSPEQAAGRLDLLGPATDVYSLGAMLYCLLTGQPPFLRGDKEDLGELLRKVEAGDYPPPRQVKLSVPRPLEAICLKAMARRMEDRYAAVEALSRDVRQWLADEVIAAYREPLMDRLRRLAKRHRTLATALAVLLMTATLALAVGMAFVNAARSETRNALEAKSAALERSETAERSAADQRELALRTVAQMVDDINTQLEDRPGQKELRKALLARALERLKEVARASDTSARVDHATICMLIELGDIFLDIEEGGTIEAKKQYEKAHELALRLVADEPATDVYQRDLFCTCVKLGDVHRRMGDSKAALTAYKESLELSKCLAEANSKSAQAQRDLCVSYINVGDVQMVQGDTRLALAAYKQSLETSMLLAKADPSNAEAQRDLSVCYDKLGEVHLRLGDKKAALTVCEQSLDLRKRLAKADPSNAHLQWDLTSSYDQLGYVHLTMGDGKAALAVAEHSMNVLFSSSTKPAKKRTWTRSSNSRKTPAPDGSTSIGWSI